MFQSITAQDSENGYLPPSSPEYDLMTETIEVAMPDGIKLSANVIRPDTQGKRFPVLFRMEPYRQDVERRYLRSAYLARRGYVVTYFHVRGTGRSEGVVPDREYSLKEIQDAEDIIEWLSQQPWSNGNVGMYGHSWSTINTYFTAARKPPALKAVWLGDCTDNIYHEDVHYLYGVLTNYTRSYNNWIDINTIQAAQPDYILDQEYFENRFNQPPWSLIYMKHQSDGEFWYRQNRLDVNPEAMSIPAYGVSGWNAPYRSSIPRLLEHAAGPTRAVIGPWTHALSRYAECSLKPGPHAEWRYDMIRWWDYWLKGKDTGIMDDPPVVTFMRYSNEALPWEVGDNPAEYKLPGEWRADTWPPKGQENQTFYLYPDHRLINKKPENSGKHNLEYKIIDGESFVYESAQLSKEITILGHPRARIKVSTTAKLANWYIHVYDVAPDGRTTPVSDGGINGAHRYTSRAPEYLIPGELYDLDIKLEVAGWIFKPGHRIRVEIANTRRQVSGNNYSPDDIWPSPYTMTTSLFLGDGWADGAGSLSFPGYGKQSSFISHITLPVVPRTSNMPLPKFVDILRSPDEHMPGVERCPPIQSSGGDDSSGGGPKTVYNEDDYQSRTTFNAAGDTTMWISNLRPDSVIVRGYQSQPVRKIWSSSTPALEDDRIVFEGTTEIRSDSLNFYYRHERWIKVDGEIIRRREWQETIPRYYQ